MEDDIIINLFSSIDLKNEQDTAEIFKIFDTFIINSVDFLMLKNLPLFLTDLFQPLLKLTIFSHHLSFPLTKLINLLIKKIKVLVLIR